MYNNEFNGFGGFQLPQYMRGHEDSKMNNSHLSESDTPEYQLSLMYPKIYGIIYPQVIIQCDMFDQACCSMRIPSTEEMEKMVADICINVEGQANYAITPNMREVENRQLDYGERGILGDLVRILVLRELFDRRHRPHRRYTRYYNEY